MIDWVEENLKLNGLWLSFTGRSGSALSFFLKIRLLFMFVVWAVNLYNFARIGVRFLFDYSAIYVPMSTCAVWTGGVVALNFTKMKKSYEDYKELLKSHKETWEKDMLFTYYEEVSKFNTFLTRCLVFSTSFLGVFQVSFDVYKAARNQPIYRILIPLSAYLDNDQTRNTYYFFIVAVSWLWFSTLITSYAGFITINSFFIAAPVIEFRIASKRIQMMSEAASEGVHLLPEWDLRELIDHHQRVICLVRSQMEFLGFPYSCQNLISSLSFCLFPFVMIRAYEDDDYMFAAIIFFLLPMLGYYIVQACYGGQQIQDAAEEVYDCLVAMPWYRQSPKVRRNLAFMIRQAQNRVSLNYKGLYHVNFRALAGVVQSSYSYFTLMKSSETK